MLRLVICFSWLILSCGQVMFWWRRDNIFGYLQAGFFFATIAIPVLATSVLDDFDPAIVNLYADIMVVGAVAFVVGLSCGAFVGHRWRLPRLSLVRNLDVVPSVLVKRARQASLGALGILALSFVLLGYLPILAADRVSAKYGIGVYAAGYARGSLVVHVGLIVASTVLPVALALYLRHRRPVDLILAGALFLGLIATLSRGRALLGPIVLLIALAIERRWRPWRIVVVVSFAFISGTLFNEIVLRTSPPGTTLGTRFVASAPDLVDHVAFLRGYEGAGGDQVGLKPVLASLSLTKGEFNPPEYALRIRTGIPDVTGFASGGLRLPAPIWGYASYGYPGLIVWSVLSGIVIGCGTVMMRRLLSKVHGLRGQCLNLVLAWVFFEGTFSVLSDFYFFERVGIVSFALAVFLCWTHVKGSPPAGSADTDKVRPPDVEAVRGAG